MVLAPKNLQEMVGTRGQVEYTALVQLPICQRCSPDCHKQQLIDKIVADLVLHKDEFTTRFVVTGKDSLTIVINLGLVISRQDMKVTQGEAEHYPYPSGTAH